MLSSNSPGRHLELTYTDVWQTGGMKVQGSDWPFEDAYNTITFTTKAVMKDRKPVLYVFHDEDDGTWQFHCDPDPKEEDAIVVGLGEVVSTDPTLLSLADLPLGRCAWREDKSDTWKREKEE